MIPFAPIKAALARAVRGVERARALSRRRIRSFEIVRDDDELELTLCGERYVMPRQDALLLPIDNISVEALAAHVASLLRALDSRCRRCRRHVAQALVVTIAESPRSRRVTRQLPPDADDGSVVRELSDAARGARAQARERVRDEPDRREPERVRHVVQRRHRHHREEREVRGDADREAGEQRRAAFGTP